MLAIDDIILSGTGEERKAAGRFHLFALMLY